MMPPMRALRRADSIVEAKVREPCVNRQQHEHGDDDEGDDAEDETATTQPNPLPAA